MKTLKGLGVFLLLLILSPFLLVFHGCAAFGKFCREMADAYDADMANIRRRSAAKDPTP